MDPFATFGLLPRFDLAPSDIEQRYRELQKALHPDRYVGRPAHERRLSLSKAVEVNEAYRILRDDLARAKALLALRGRELSDGHPGDPEFLMEVMERREALSASRTDLARVRTLAAEVQAENDRARARIHELFETTGDLSAIADELARMRYHRRFLDECAAIEEAFEDAPRA